MFEKVVLAVDGSSDSQKAVSVACDLGKAHHSEVLVLHAHEHARGRGAPLDLETQDEAKAVVDAAVAAVKKVGLEARGEVLSAFMGRAAGAIVSAADGFGAGLIIMGTRGHSDLAGLLLGSVSHKVIQLAHCPVLVVR
jgi:nucleotide-binding universal stress UspA family protein